MMLVEIDVACVCVSEVPFLCGVRSNNNHHNNTEHNYTVSREGLFQKTKKKQTGVQTQSWLGLLLASALAGQRQGDHAIDPGESPTEDL